IQCGDL
ncbi:RNA polymerase subunit RPO18, partial [Monkeypox virus]